MCETCDGNPSGPLIIGRLFHLDVVSIGTCSCDMAPPALLRVRYFSKRDWRAASTVRTAATAKKHRITKERAVGE